MLPPPFHLLPGRLVRLVPAGDHVLQVGVLCLDDFVSGTAMVRVLTGSTQLATGHGLHRTHLPFIDTVIARTPPSSEVTPGRSGRDCPRGRGTRSRALPTAASPAPGAPRRPDRLEGGVEVVRTEDRSLQRPLNHEREQGIALGLRTPSVWLGEHDVDIVPRGAEVLQE